MYLYLPTYLTLDSPIPKALTLFYYFFFLHFRPMIFYVTCLGSLTMATALNLSWLSTPKLRPTVTSGYDPTFDNTVNPCFRTFHRFRHKSIYSHGLNYGPSVGTIQMTHSGLDPYSEGWVLRVNHKKKFICSKWIIILNLKYVNRNDLNTGLTSIQMV